MHWIIVGICIGIGLMLARPILIFLFYVAITLLAFGIVPFMIGVIKGYFFP